MLFRERPLDLYEVVEQEDVFGPGHLFYRLRRDPVFLFANNTKRIVELFLIPFSGKLGP